MSLLKVSLTESVSYSRPQYHRLNALMEMFGDLNFTVLGFSCNQFGLQSPGRYTAVCKTLIEILQYIAISMNQIFKNQF